ncbi:MAG: hypothetical protein EZS28_055320, partial [Streblomastix strix]
ADDQRDSEGRRVIGVKVKGVKRGTTHQRLTQLFRQYNPTHVNLQIDQADARFDFAIVFIEPAELCQQAVDKLSGTILDGHQLSMQLCYSWSTKKREREHSKREAELWVMVQGFAAGLTPKEFMTLVGQYKNKGAWASDEV